jgi:hypothetical protein
MNTAIIFLILIPAAVIVILQVALPRIRMERRARALLKQHPDAERTSVYLSFRSGWAGGKRRELDAKISEMSTAGWIFLRAVEASPVRTLFSWGGGLSLHFIRDHSSGELRTRPTA